MSMLISHFMIIVWFFFCRGPPPPGMIRPGMHPPFPPRGPDPFMHGPRPGMGPGPGLGMDHGPGFGPRPRFPPGPNGPPPGPMPGPQDGPFLPPSMFVCRSAILRATVTLRLLCFSDLLCLTVWINLSKLATLKQDSLAIVEYWPLLGGLKKSLMYHFYLCLNQTCV